MEELTHVCSLSTWTNDSYGTDDGRAIYSDGQGQWFEQCDDGPLEAIDFKEVQRQVDIAPPAVQKKFESYIKETTYAM